MPSREKQTEEAKGEREGERERARAWSTMKSKGERGALGNAEEG